MAAIWGLGAAGLVLVFFALLGATAASARRSRVTGRLARRPPRATRAWRRWPLGSASAVMAALLVGGPGLAALVAGAAMSGPFVWRTLAHHRNEEAVEKALPVLLEAVARGLRSGTSLRQALAEASREFSGPLGHDLRSLVAEVEQGADLVKSLDAWPGRRPLPGVRLAVAALCLGAETGGPRAAAVDGVASTLRQRLTARAEARALGTQARLSAWVIAVAPLGFCIIASSTDFRSARFLFGTPLGLACVAAGLALDAAGALWMARLTRIEA